jgi:nitroreductase
MEILRAIQERKSIRKFKPDPVPREMIEEILQAAQRSPSAINTQPWECWVAGAEITKQLAQEMYQAGENGEVTHPDFHITERWEEVYMNRMRENGKRLFGMLGIQGQEGKKAFALSMFKFYEAPHVIYVCLDESLGPYAIFDCGCYVQTLCLLAASKGLGTCIMDSAVRYPSIVRKHLRIPPQKRILVGIAIGHPDHEAIINQFESNRESLENVVHWQDI